MSVLISPFIPMPAVDMLMTGPVGDPNDSTPFPRTYAAQFISEPIEDLPSPLVGYANCTLRQIHDIRMRVRHWQFDGICRFDDSLVTYSATLFSEINTENPYLMQDYPVRLRTFLEEDAYQAPRPWRGYAVSPLDQRPEGEVDQDTLTAQVSVVTSDASNANLILRAFNYLYPLSNTWTPEVGGFVAFDFAIVYSLGGMGAHKFPSATVITGRAPTASSPTDSIAVAGTIEGTETIGSIELGGGGSFDYSWIMRPKAEDGWWGYNGKYSVATGVPLT